MPPAGLNLHGLVRGAINRVNPDVQAVYLRSKGAVDNADGTRTPAYQAPFFVGAQLQPPSARDLRHMEYLNLQGVLRTAFLYSNPQGIVRVSQTGGDLLMFPQSQPHVLYDSNGDIVYNSAGQPVLASTYWDLWLLTPAEWFDVNGLGFTKAYAQLQADGRQIVLNSKGLPVLSSSGTLVTSTQ